MYDASDRRHVAKAEKQAKNADALAASFVRVAMASIEGRAWFSRFLERCSIFHTPFTANANATAFNCGIQSKGLEVLAEIMAQAPDAYILMMRERNERSSSPGPSDDRHRRGESNGDGRDNDLPGDAAVTSEYDPGDERAAEAD